VRSGYQKDKNALVIFYKKGRLNKNYRVTKMNEETKNLKKLIKTSRELIKESKKLAEEQRKVMAQLQKALDKLYEVKSK
jgi:hypothetical protein